MKLSHHKEIYEFCASILNAEELKDIPAIERSESFWAQFVYFSSSHLILPTLYHKLISNNATHILPKDLLDFMAEMFKKNCFRNEKMIQHASYINKCFKEQGIETLFIKGMGNILDGLYSNIGDRITTDIDILVQEKDFLNAAEVLQQNEYKSKDKFDYKKINIIKHYPSLSHPKYFGKVELHIRATDYKYVHNIPTNALFERKKECIYQNETYFVLSDEDKIKLNFLHSQLNNFCHITAYPFLRDINDLYLLSKKIPVEPCFNTLKSRHKKAKQYHDFMLYVFENKQINNNSILRRFKKNLKSNRIKRSFDSYIKIVIRKYFFIFLLAVVGKKTVPYLYNLWYK